MKNNYNNSSEENLEEKDDFIQEVFKYVFFWKYFMLSILLFFFIAFLFNRYSDKIYETNAKIKILDKKESSLNMPSTEDLFSNSKINLENEIEIIKSYTILEKLVKNLNLNISVEAVGKIKGYFLVESNYPFLVTPLLNNDFVLTKSFEVSIKDNVLAITNTENEKEYLFNELETFGINHDLPFNISNVNKDKFGDIQYKIYFHSVDKVIRILKQKITASIIGKNSNIINLQYNTSNPLIAQKVLNELINVFNDDGVKDRQLVHKRTIDFVNSRYSYLLSELDSIESNKKKYKITNELVNFQSSSLISLEQSTTSEKDILLLKNQIFIVKNILKTLSQLSEELLPTNMGIENREINNLINIYNQKILDRNKITSSAGPKNPVILQINNNIKDLNSNIILSLETHLENLKNKEKNLLNEIASNDNRLLSFPEQEKTLRSIDRNQSIKESLYLFLLQKGEEAQVNYAITEPSIKVVEYAVSSLAPIYPNSLLSYLIALLIALLIPFIILYIIFYLDNKVHSREDLEKLDLNVLGEIPFFQMNENDKVFKDKNDRSIISEAFRMLMSNVKYLLSSEKKNNIIVVTSSVKGEGKTLNALNLSLAFSSLDKKVLLIGCDLRNPQLHKYINLDKNVPGLVDFLVDKNVDWTKNILKPFENNSNLHLLLSGPLPPNPLNLINNGNLNILLEQARNQYDYVIIDSAPTLLVADTLTIFKIVDTIIYLTRVNVTEKPVLRHISNISNEFGVSLGVVLNGVGQSNSYGYSYGYKYGYGYNYKYSYNYGYGYGYSSDDE